MQSQIPLQSTVIMGIIILRQMLPPSKPFGDCEMIVLLETCINQLQTPASSFWVLFPTIN